MNRLRRGFVWAVIGLLVVMLVATLFLDASA
jgi:FtsH-binding integral membrane protein